MLCRSLRQAATSARLLRLAEQRLLASVPTSISQVRPQATLEVLIWQRTRMTLTLLALQDFNTAAAGHSFCWTCSADGTVRLLSSFRSFSSAQRPTNADEGSEREAAEATASPSEEQAEIPVEEEPVDPKDLLLAEKDQQVSSLCLDHVVCQLLCTPLLTAQLNR